ncbi:hypothetical protein HDU76_004463 [Blyttiomyces sp. JEL0837]|nr:hypothetical protein HDU76_004463 [Blyttiomyces sp. JEL0837]
MTGGPITLYLIFYGNFTNLEIERIENYAKYISDPSTKPNWWSIAMQFFDSKGGKVGNILRHGGSVLDFYTFGNNISTTFSGLAGDPTMTDVSDIILSNIGTDNAFPYDPLGIYVVLTSPDVINSDYANNSVSYGAYHFSYNLTFDDDTPKVINHIFAHTIGFETTTADLKAFPNGDTGRRVVDLLCGYLHHELFEAISDPDPMNRIAWADTSTPSYGIGEVGDACEYGALPWSHLSFTNNTQKSIGRFYNTIINNQIYALQDVWVFDKEGIQACQSQVLSDPQMNEWRSIKNLSNPVTGSMDIVNYTGPVHIPCKAFYIDRNHGGYTTLNENVCHTYFNGVSYSSNKTELGAIDIPVNYYVLSQQYRGKNAGYRWARIDESNAMMVKETDVNPPLAPGGLIFVVYQDNFVPLRQRNNGGLWIPVNHGDYYHCRAFVQGVWRVGETRRTMNSCVVVVDGVILQVPKGDPSVAYLVRPFV